MRQALLQRHKKERDRRVADRIKAVILRDDGRPQSRSDTAAEGEAGVLSSSVIP
jgi:hypothetical protein